MVFEFTQNLNAWRRILDVQNRQSDDGFYVNPNNVLDVYPEAAGTTSVSENAYHDVVLTVSSAGQVVAYLDGNPEFTIPNDSVMDINNPGNLLNFFLDNTVGGGIGEYSSGRIGLIRVYNGVLGASQVASQAANPFAGTTVPEPSSIALIGIASTFGLGVRLRGRCRPARS